MFGVGWLSSVKLFFVRIPISSRPHHETCECSWLFASRPREVRKRLPGGRSALCQSGDWLGINMFWASVPRPCSPPTGVCLIVGVNPRSSQTLFMHRIHQSLGLTPQVAFIDDAGDNVFVSPIQNLIQPRNAGNPRHKPIAGHLIP